MKFLVSYHTDIGIKKPTNQDSLLIKTANTSDGKIGLFAICDGMGGLSNGELASATVISGLAKWFDNEFPKLLTKQDVKQAIILSLKQYIRFANSKICNYGKENNMKLGTTITAMVIINNEYIIAHVGDSRAYKIDKNLYQITKDQSFVQREVDRGNITKEEAKNHNKRNLLLQCIGVTPDIEVLTYTGKINKDDVYFLCTDGFYHKISDSELINNLNGKRLKNETQMKSINQQLVELAKKRREVDNISMIHIKVI